VTKCKEPEQTVTDGSGSWKKYGYEEDRLPPIGVESEVVTRYYEDKIRALEEQMDGRECRVGTKAKLKEQVEELKKAQGEYVETAKKVQTFLAQKGIAGADKDSQGLDIKTKQFAAFEEMSKLLLKERTKRNFSGAQLDPNHSHFIFADDGRLMNYGAETQLRADIESCIAGLAPQTLNPAPSKQLESDMDSRECIAAAWLPACLRLEKTAYL
jgi:hypothetical protein